MNTTPKPAMSREETVNELRQWKDSWPMVRVWNKDQTLLTSAIAHLEPRPCECVEFDLAVSSGGVWKRLGTYRVGDPCPDPIKFCPWCGNPVNPANESHL